MLTKHQTKTIKRLILKGMSLSSIAVKLGLKKSDVSGVALKRDKSYIAIKRVQLFKEPECFNREPMDTDITMMELSSTTCRFMVRQGFYCGLYTTGTYCREHQSICWIKK